MPRSHDPTRQVSPGVSDGSAPQGPHRAHAASSPNQALSGESQKTLHSDAKKWFDHSNQNPAAILNSHVTDVDPPFFQKESDSSNEDKSSEDHHQLPPPTHGQDHSSSADDYRSVIDDLTVEIQKLKEELKRYKQRGPEMLRSEKLFEIRIHGLPKSKKQELETTLRDFAATLGDSPVASTSQPKRSSRKATRHHTFLDSGSFSVSKHASSSSGSNIRHGDSAYASVSTGPNSVGNSLGRPLAASRMGFSDQKVENYLRDIPKGLYPRHVAMTEKEKKKLVVRRLEQIFTGKISGRHARRSETNCELESATSRWGATTAGAGAGATAAPAAAPAEFQPHKDGIEPLREAKIVPLELDSRLACKKAWTRDVTSGSDSNGDCPGPARNSNHIGVGKDNHGRTDPSPAAPSLPEQRPTRLKDLDPDRVQIPSENMEYMRHLGLAPLEPILLASSDLGHNVHADADGWVYLNLLCNMAQLHIINVTPDFVRAAVTELSAKFQLSSDGRKIRWRGGTEGTKFSSDSSGGNSQRSAETDDTETSKDGARKRRKIGRSTGDDCQPMKLTDNLPTVGVQRPSSSESFHYQPLFVHGGSPHERVSTDYGTWSSFGPAKNSLDGNLEWCKSGSVNASNGQKRRHDGTIIYYSGAPFCTDLSGDPGDTSPTVSMPSDDPFPAARRAHFSQPDLELKSWIACRPLSDGNLHLEAISNVEVVKADEVAAGSNDGRESQPGWDFPWSNRQQLVDVHPLEPSGLGGVLPEDHFMVIVTTERPKHDGNSAKPEKLPRSLSEEAAKGMAARLATLPTFSRQIVKPTPQMRYGMALLEIRYVLESVKRLAPERLPPAAIFLPPLSLDSWSEDEDEDEDDEFASEDEGEFACSEEFMPGEA